MSFFCLLWVPLFYLFWRTFRDGSAGPGGIWAFILGTAAAVVRFFLGDIVGPGGFGLSRWLYACVDVVALPALLPMLIYLLFILFKVISGPFDFANFALLWLIPLAFISALNWSPKNDPLFLVLAPLLWTAAAVGIPFFIDCIRERPRWYVIVPCALVIPAIPFITASSWWAFFSGRLYLGSGLLAAALVPLAVSITVSWVKMKA